eukprot:CAMPEP_0177711046 /NCGR_PEP_ID=MMETSP0484_2-20121128/11651_1 /TAXON_ID=354590 /ORGANISM="Rhodomonas lens, Strain RHODO" /LENGTH=163 /DNA_ID=CAMNT_0019222751 /DNA_START=76 /DNA_END=567 /DNA_ORIENTATION=-
MAMQASSSLFLSSSDSKFSLARSSSHAAFEAIVDEQAHRSDDDDATSVSSVTCSSSSEDTIFSKPVLNYAANVRFHSLATGEGRKRTRGDAEEVVEIRMRPADAGQARKRMKLQSSFDVEGEIVYVECPASRFVSKRRRFNLLVGLALQQEEEALERRESGTA